MNGLRNANLAVRFLLELGALAAAGYWGATTRYGAVARIMLAIAAPLAIAIVWATFISPKARVPTGRVGRSVLGFVVFSAAALALDMRGHAQLAATYWAVALISSALLLALPQ